MKLVDEIIEMASDGKRSLSDALRKCLVLAFELKNEKLKYWIEKELNGFNTGDEIPDYRKALLHSKGNFSGPMGAWIPQRPLPVSIIDKKHRDMLTSKLVQPIAAYEGSARSSLDTRYLRHGRKYPPPFWSAYVRKCETGSCDLP
jgi:hypothetical protein